MKYPTFPKLLLLAGCLLALGCGEEPVDREAEAERLMQASRDWSAAAQARDVEKTLDYWAEDAVVITAGQPELRGRQAIRGMIEGSFADPNFAISWEPVSAEVSESGDLGYLIEDSRMTMADSTGSPLEQEFRSVTIWKRQADGSWKNVVDVMSPLGEG
ncbi:uncharacterized protein (TIGR02246 family) [Lewinella marina]|uniref:DUF4440 domain-containing protein n=1 Tax=Neolewinella marina TaxID=438751 RepID=A0A2G0CKL2_9BACT|nr:SgcJ/EcaC family oxidoreductase [Neolewinella marina]NJB84329.1 uncharacterized protein (TIGR02246 family) [Neolewinella marina]PHL00471.1 hypothetical protein CGL56_05415 [Neolewinella marina]